MKFTALLPAIVSTLFVLPATAVPPAPDSYWKITPPIDVNDVYYAGQKQIPRTKDTLIYNGSAGGRTYAHTSMLLAKGNSVYLTHTTSAVDEDMQGQEVWASVSHDAGKTWTKTQPNLPAAMLANQTDPGNYTYWCSTKVWQRALAPMAILEVKDKIWNVALVMVFMCPDGASKWRQGAGLVARAINPDGSPSGAACWLEKNQYTDMVAFKDTVYGTEWGMQDCADKDLMNDMMAEPDKVVFGSNFMFNNRLAAADTSHVMEEPTHAVWINDTDVAPSGGYWQRFWRDGNGGGKLWVETTADKEGSDWYPRVLQEEGNEIYVTNIPDRSTKPFLGMLHTGDRYLVHNPRFNSSCSSGCDRSPLIVSMSRGSDLSYRRAGVLRTHANPDKIPGRSKNPGFSYPSAVEVDGKLLVVYSENKENIWTTSVDLRDLPGGKCDVRYRR